MKVTFETLSCKKCGFTYKLRGETKEQLQIIIDRHKETCR